MAFQEYCAPKIVSGPESYREFRETGPWWQMADPS